MKQLFISIICLLIIQVTFGQNKIIEQELIKKNQDAIIEEFVTNCAEKYNYNYQMAEWQNCLDEGLKKDSTVAFLWQQKSMPYFKAKATSIKLKHIRVYYYLFEENQPSFQYRCYQNYHINPSA